MDASAAAAITVRSKRMNEALPNARAPSIARANPCLLRCIRSSPLPSGELASLFHLSIKPACSAAMSGRRSFDIRGRMLRGFRGVRRRQHVEELLLRVATAHRRERVDGARCDAVVRVAKRVRQDAPQFPRAGSLHSARSSDAAPSSPRTHRAIRDRGSVVGRAFETSCEYAARRTPESGSDASFSNCAFDVAE